MSEIELEKIADILPPTAPQNETDAIWIVLISFILLIIIAVIKHYRSDKQQLKRLQKKYNNNEINQRQLALTIACFLKNNTEKKHENKLFNEQLQAACFSRNGVDEHTMKLLISQTKKWI
jgi:uncharacterized membrane protein (DUF106 family)